MSESAIVNNARALMNVLHPMTGSQRAVRTVMATAAPSTQFFLKPGMWLFPIIGTPLKQRPDLLFKVRKNPARVDGMWLITDAGTPIEVISNIGGVRHNVPISTRFTFDFPMDNLVTMVVSAIVQEATDPAQNCDIKYMDMYEQIEPSYFIDLRRSTIKDFPAVVVTFDALTPADGTSVSAVSRGARGGVRSALYKATYQLTVFSSRSENDSIRRVEGMSILDRMMRYLSDRNQTDDGDCLSNPGGVQIVNAFRDAEAQELFQKYYVYVLLVATTFSLNTTDNRVYNPWLRACLNVDKSADPAGTPPDALRLVEDNCIDMEGIPSNAIVDDNGIPILDDFGNFILYTG